MQPPARPEAEPLEPSELAALPVFPLPRVVLLPGQLLPLHVFEQRYRDLVEHCLTHGPHAIAVATLAPGWEADYEGRPKIEAVAGAGRIVAQRRNPDATYDLVLAGCERVVLEELPAGELSFRRARARVLEEVEGPAQEVARTRADTLVTAAALAGALRGHGIAAPQRDAQEGAGRLADKLADRYFGDPAMRQRVLEEPRVLARLNLVAEGLAELLARVSALRTAGGTSSGSGGAPN